MKIKCKSIAQKTLALTATNINRMHIHSAKPLLNKQILNIKCLKNATQTTAVKLTLNMLLLKAGEYFMFL